MASKTFAYVLPDDTSLAKNIYYDEFHVTNWTIWYNSPSFPSTHQPRLNLYDGRQQYRSTL